MRMGVIDVGSNTVHLLVVDAHWGAHPIPARSHKQELRLSEHVEEDGSIAASGSQSLVRFVHECQDMADELGIETLLGFATSAIREAPNGDAVLQQVREETGLELHVLPGEDESRLTFLAARRWFGWSAGRIQLIDIGGGSLEFASGIDEDPDVAFSLPLGAGRVSRTMLPGDPPKTGVIKEARKDIRTAIAREMRDLAKVGAPDIVVGTSKTIRTLARIGGAAPSAEGPYVRRILKRDAVKVMVPQLAAMKAADRVQLPGVSTARAHQILAGALVIEASMDLLDVEQLTVCPWALREGVILQQLDAMSPDASIAASTWLTAPVRR